MYFGLVAARNGMSMLVMIAPARVVPMMAVGFCSVFPPQDRLVSHQLFVGAVRMFSHWVISAFSVVCLTLKSCWSSREDEQKSVGMAAMRRTG